MQIQITLNESDMQAPSLAVQCFMKGFAMLGGAVETVTDKAPHHVQGHGLGGHSTAERLAALREALKSFSQNHPSFGGITGSTLDCVKLLAPYGYPDSGRCWWGKDFKALSKTDTERSYSYDGDERPCQYGITWAPDRPKHIISSGSSLGKKKKTNQKEKPYAV